MKHFKIYKVIAFLLIMGLLFSSIPVEAANKSDKEIETRFISVLKSINKYKTTSSSNMKIISDYLGINSSLLLSAENEGYSVKDSISIAKLKKNTDLSYGQIKQGIKSYKSIIAFSIAVEQYKGIIDSFRFKTKTINDIKKCLTLGYDMLDIRHPAIIAEMCNSDLLEVIHSDANSIQFEVLSNYFKDDLSEVSQFVIQNNVDLSWLYNYLNNNKIGWKNFYGQFAEYISGNAIKTSNQEKSLSNTNSDVSSLISEPLMSEPSMSVTSDKTLASTEDKYKAPFSYDIYNEDKIEMNTGNLNVENVDVYLPGKNGLDVKLVSRYNSAEQFGEKEIVNEKTRKKTLRYYLAVRKKTYIYGSSAEIQDDIVRLYNDLPYQEYERLREVYKNDIYQTSADGQYIYKFYLKESSSTFLEQDVNELYRNYTPTHSQQKSPMGIGWGFEFDSVEIVNSNSYFNENLQKNMSFLERQAGMYLHLENGQTYKITDALNLEGYNLNDLKFRIDDTFVNSQNIRSKYLLQRNNGIKEYFDVYGTLIAKLDKFNNKIEYHQTKIKGYPVITKIIDTLNREIGINYDFSNKKVIVTAPEGRQVIYNLSNSFGLALLDPNSRVYSEDYTYTYFVTSRTDFENRTTKYDYEKQSKDWFALNDYACAVPSATYKLKKITYPTNSFVEYTYESKGRFISQGASEWYSSVVNRNATDTKKNNTYQRKYVYRNNYTRYPFTEIDRVICDELRALYPEKYSYVVIDINNSFVAKEYNFDYINQMNSEDRYRTFNLTTVDKYYMLDSIKYDYNSQSHQLSKKTTKNYIIPGDDSNNQDLSKYLLTVEDYDYDTYGNLISYWGPDASRDSNNNLVNASSDTHLVKYSYDTSNYNILLQKDYYKDAATLISEKNTLTSDYKKISQSVINLNGTLVAKSAFDYDQWNNMNNEKRYLKDNNWTRYVETKYSYADNTTRNSTYNFNGAYLTQKHIDSTLYEGEEISAAKDEIYKYDTYGNQITFVDGKNNKISYDYDKLARLLKKTNADLSTVVYNYDNVNNYLTVKNENNKQLRYEFDGFGNLLNKVDVESGKSLESYKYNSDFKLDTQWNSQGLDSSNSIKYSYYRDGRIKSKIVYDKGGNRINEENYSYVDSYDLNGDGISDCSKTTKTIIGDNVSPTITSCIYSDKNGRVIRESTVNNEKELYRTYQYDYLGNKTQEKSSRANDEKFSEQYTVKYNQDFYGNVTEVTDILGHKTTMEYDALGRLVKKKDNKANSQNLSYSTEYVYDNQDKLVVEKIPFEKDESGNIYYSIKKHFYDSNNNVISEKSTNNKPGEAAKYSRTDYEYNSRNQLTKVTNYNNNSPENYTQYYYDLVGNKRRMYTGLSSPLVINGLDNVAVGSDTSFSTTKYEYNSLNMLVNMIDPSNQVETYDYDLNGNQVKKTDRNGNVISTKYDGLGRALTITAVTPDNNGDIYISNTYTLTGNKASASNGANTTYYYYDNLGRLVTEAAVNVVKAYSYDADNNRKSFTLSVNGIAKLNTSYVYDKMNRLESVLENGIEQARYTYDENNSRGTLLYSNGNLSEYQYNLANKLKMITNKKGAAVLSSNTYSYFLDGNQAAKTDNLGKLTSYNYDGLGRLTSETPVGDPAISYTYDDNNNRSTMTVAGSYVTTYAYDKANRLQAETKAEGQSSQITRYKYDNNGNTVCKTLETVSPVAEGQDIGISLADKDSDVTFYEYDGFNQLTKTTTGDTTVNYTYNGDGLRTSKTVNGNTTSHIWDGDQIALELNGAGSVTNKYVRGINLLSSENGNGADKRYFLYNGHGDVIQLTDTAGNLVKSYDYDAFGNEKAPDPNDTNLFRYCGEYFDKETGTIYLRARYYDPGIGRFITEDSYRGKNSDPLSLNLYTYCGNNPIMYFDPSGHLSDEYLFRLAGDSPVNSGDYSQIKNPVARVYCAWGNTIPSKRISVLSNSSATFWGTEFYLRLLYLYEYKGIDVTQLSRNQLDAIYEEVHMNKVGELMAGLDASAMIAGNIGKYIVKGTSNAINASELKMSKTVQNHMNDIIKKGANKGDLARPYIDSNGTTMLVDEIMKGGTPVKDTVLKNGLRWDVEGTFRGSTGTWELVVDTSSNTIVHFNFVAK